MRGLRPEPWHRSTAELAAFAELEPATRSPSESLKSIWLDVVSPQPLAIKFAHDFMGADRLLFSSDHPWVEPAVIVDKIFSGNARKLFRL